MGDSTIEELLLYVRQERGVDLRDHRDDSISRGVEARLVALGLQDERELLLRLRARPSEIDRLIEALVVPVSRFYRNPAVFDALRACVVPALCDARTGSELLRVWSVGTSAGEEAWSVAMLLSERCAGPTAPRFEVLGSDIDERALSIAAAGCYAQELTDGIPSELRERFLAPTEGGQVRVVDELRPHVSFARHDLMGHELAPRQAVLAAFDLVFLRNVLIYFQRRLQEKALERVLRVLPRGGALVLGPVESLPTSLGRAFTPFPGTEPALRIFQRVS